MNIQSLITSSLNGDQKAMRALFDAVSPKVNYVCQRHFDDPQDVKEAVQISMIRIFKKLEQFDPSKGEFFGWSYRIAMNESLRLIRKNARFEHEDIDEINKDSEDLGIDEQLNSSESLELLNCLKGNHRVVFNLFFVEGYNHKEIGEQLGISEITSRTTYHRAKKKLQEYYSLQST